VTRGTNTFQKHAQLLPNLGRQSSDRSFKYRDIILNLKPNPKIYLAGWTV
jgi:hypothetical protein